MGAGVDFIDFVLADNPFYSSTTYRAFWGLARASYQWTSALDVRGGLKLMPVVGLGESEADFGEESSTFGFVVEAEVRYDLFAGLNVRAGYRLLLFSSSFEGVGVRELEEVETSDMFNELSFLLGYTY